MAVNKKNAFWNITFAVVLLYLFQHVNSETENCKLLDYDTSPGSACECRENVEQNLCYVYRVRLENGDCDNCEAGYYLSRSSLKCKACPPEHNCERNVYENCRPCEKRDETTISSTTTSTTTETTSTPDVTNNHTPIQDSISITVSPEPQETSESTTTTSKLSTIQAKMTMTTTTTLKNENHLTNQVSFYISVACVFVVLVVVFLLFYHRKKIGRFFHLLPPEENQETQILMR